MKIGYGGTKTEMQRLLTDATKFSGVKYDMSNLGDVYEAIHVIQGEMGITGTTAKEASETISGSLNAMKSSFTNVLAKLTLGEDIKPSLNALAKTMKVFFVDNLLPALSSILSALPSVFKTFAIAIAPQLKSAGKDILSNLFSEESATVIMSMLDKIKSLIEKSFGQLVTVFKTLKENADILIPILGGVLSGFVAFKVITGIINGIAIAQSLWALAMTATISPILLVAVAIGSLIAIGIALWKNWDVIKEKASQLWGFLGNVFEFGKTLLKNTVENMWSSIKNTFTTVTNVIKTIISSFWTAVQIVFTFAINFIKASVNFWLSGMQFIITNVMNAIKFVISAFWNGVKIVFTTSMNLIKTSVDFWINGIKLVISTVMNVIKSVFSTVWDGIKVVVETTINVIKSSINGWMNLVNQLIALGMNIMKRTFETVWNGIKLVITTVIDAIKTVITSVFGGISSFISSVMNTIKSNMSNAWTSVKDTTSTMLNNVKTTATNIFNDLVERVKALPSRMADGIRAGAGALKSAFLDMFNSSLTAIAKPIDGIIGGANWVLERLGAKKIATWTVPAYEKGTPTDGHQGGHALVNDQKGSTYRELVRLPDGQEFIPEGRNVLLPNLPIGSHVVPAMQTQKLYKYAKGTKGVGNLIAEKALDIFSFAKKPLELAKTAISKFVNTSSMKQGFAKDASEGLVSKATTSMSSFFKSKLDEVMSAFGGGGSEGGKIDFGGLRVTSPYGMRTHPISGGRRMHTGIDYAGGQGAGHPIKAQAGGIVNFAGAMGGYGNVIRTKAGIYEYLYAHLSKTIAKMGQSVSRGDLLGLMGTTGNSTGNHVHYETRRNGQHIDPNSIMGKGGSSSPLGTGVERWRGTVVKALGMNGLPVTSNYVDAWLRQIKTESGGNPLAVQGNIGDINNRTGDLAKGLVQVIGATFNRYKFPGHGNRMNGLDSLLAGMNYAKNRYGVTGMLNKIGKGRGYKNGGIITKEHLAKVGEGGDPEAIIPLTNKSRARTLIKKTQKVIGMNDEMSVLTAILQELKNNKSDSIVNINVAELHVREEADIEKIATVLHRKQMRQRKALGIA